MEKTNTLKIRTPEGVSFSLRLACPVTRFLAWLTDLLCIMTIGKCLNGVMAVFAILSRDLSTSMAILSYFIVSMGYGILLEWCMNGQTVGKRLLHLRVMDAEGLHLRFSQIVIRNLLRFVDSFPATYMAGGISVLVSENAQRIGDIAANTVVVRNPPVHEPHFDQLFSAKFNSFRNYPHLSARLRQRVPPEQAHIALQALLRRNSLAPSSRIDLFGEIAARFKSMVEFPGEAMDGLSDEQYTRNVVELLFRPAGAPKEESRPHRQATGPKAGKDSRGS